MNRPSRQRLHPARRRAQLLDCAMRVFADQGLERAGHGDIAKLAGVSTPTVFNYFPTREDLVDAVLGEIKALVMTMFEAMPDIEQSPGNQVKMMAAIYAEFTQNNPDMSKVYLNWSVSFGEYLRAQYLAFQEAVLDELDRRINSPRTDRSDARIIIASANMFAMMTLDHTDPDIVERFVNRVAEAIDS